ncbi:MAG: DUF4013 domain-containing protein [Candidatus Diapherotrites archaeon]|nr:DUF4013 domain-containing protein [Candidatus Diapherotrites archaeon]
MDIAGAFKKPFSDITKLAIGIIVSLIPIVNILLLPGYLFRVAVNSTKGKPGLPEWSDPVGLVVRSLKLIVLMIIYYIPAIIVGAIGVGAAISAILANPGNILNSMTTAIAAGGVFILLALLLALLGGLFGTSAMLLAARTNRIGDGLKFGEAVKNFFRLRFIAALAIVLIIAVIINVVLGVIPVVGWVLALLLVFPLQTAYITILAEGYN